ncbi:acetyl-CoA carboxylase carboxyl transferase subunit beta [Candidatus Aerophobetes bacterium]|uniref:Acetyl-coenzyme A carboxylase carboxyl transferase subunit beta n=1 Tax=Aerophobetes bacterium TaxID=2030807 RepID=A0A2A4WYY6_UNCAE|nr:MAG: acetyl-CoA carboxylase carboxyl transferase subunit beta [Candidatus Aerophobetes bacterium]
MGFLRLFTRTKPKLRVSSSKKDGFSGWIKCAKCSEMIHAKELGETLHCCPKCDHHYRYSVSQRIELFADGGEFEELFSGLKSSDPLGFVDTKAYKERLKEADKKGGKSDAIVTGLCKMGGEQTALGVMNFSFMGGSMGSVVGEKLTRLIELAIEKHLPLVVVSSSGGARMQESVLSLMQMAKTSAALARLGQAGLPFISVLAHPTTGGVTASFASLGDVNIAEPDALIGFAGPRVVEQTIGEKLPQAAQKSEFLLEKGMIDRVVHRKNLKKEIVFFIKFLVTKSNNVPESGGQEAKEKLDVMIEKSKQERQKNKVEVVNNT